MDIIDLTREIMVIKSSMYKYKNALRLCLRLSLQEPDKNFLKMNFCTFFVFVSACNKLFYCLELKMGD